MKAKLIFIALCGALAASLARAGDYAAPPAANADGGLGALPHYSLWQEPWVDAVPAATAREGLAALRHYAQWQEPWLDARPAQGLDGELGEMLDVARIIAVWVYAYPADEIDGGRGEIPRAASPPGDASPVALRAR